MKLPDDVFDILWHKFANRRREWLKSSLCGNEGAETWPMEISLSVPAEKDALLQLEKTRSWISAWEKWQGKGKVVWGERRWRTLGTQNVPEKLKLETPEDIAAWTGNSQRWSRAVSRYKFLTERWPALIDVLSKYFNVLADYEEPDFFNLHEMLSWICANPNSNLYVRQIPVSGIDSKWLESHKSLVCELVDTIRGIDARSAMSESRDFFRLCGLKPLPQRIRLRLLDPDLRRNFAGLGDISAPLDEIANLGIDFGMVFIVENIQTALAFDDIKNSAVIMGLGYGVDVLANIPWLHRARTVYWGDIDTHGFAILHRARSYLPNLETVLMDEGTLFNHRDLWVEEKSQSPTAELPLLTDAERSLFQSLKHNAWGQRVRLEQERIRWDYAWDALRKII
ncbi:MAG: DUF2220 family protein [Treponema sp.]|nr:DUF2220 family protein [Treponema sp.]